VTTEPTHPMPKEISALNTYYLLYYLETNYPEVDFEQIISRLTDGSDYCVENLQTGKLEQVTLSHLKNSSYWFSHDFIQRFYDLIGEHIPDPRLAYKIGRTLYKTQPLIKSAIGIPLLGLHRVAHRVSSEAAKFNRTKSYHISDKARGYIVIRVVHQPNIIVNEFTRQWNAGVITSYALLAGARDVSIDIKTIDPGPQKLGDPGQTIWEFTIRYKDPTIAYRFTKAVVFNLPWVRELIERADEKEYEHIEQIRHLDHVIQERTDQLVRMKEKLIAGEREIIESKIENISLALISTEERERRLIAQNLHNNVIQLLTVSRMHVETVLKEVQQKEALTDIHQKLSLAIDNLQALSFQISPSVLYDYGLSAAISCMIEDINNNHGIALQFKENFSSSIQLSQDYTILLYRTIRELVITLIKHGWIKDGCIELYSKETCLNISFHADHQDFTPDLVEYDFTLYAIQEKIKNLKGNFSIEADKKGETVITISMPLGVICDL